MAAVENTVPEIELNDVDRAILRELIANGRASTTLLSNVTDVSRTYAGDRVRRLREHEYIEELEDGPRLYDVTGKGRREVEDPREDPRE